MLPTLQGYCKINEFIHMVTLYLMAEIKAQRKSGKTFMPMKQDSAKPS